jgi:hypothetical protein
MTANLADDQSCIAPGGEEIGATKALRISGNDVAT